MVWHSSQCSRVFWGHIYCACIHTPTVIWWHGPTVLITTSVCSARNCIFVASPSPVVILLPHDSRSARYCRRFFISVRSDKTSSLLPSEDIKQDYRPYSDGWNDMAIGPALPCGDHQLQPTSIEFIRFLRTLIMDFVVFLKAAFLRNSADCRAMTKTYVDCSQIKVLDVNGARQTTHV